MHISLLVLSVDCNYCILLPGDYGNFQYTLQMEATLTKKIVLFTTV